MMQVSSVGKTAPRPQVPAEAEGRRFNADRFRYLARPQATVPADAPESGGDLVGNPFIRHHRRHLGCLRERLAEVLPGDPHGGEELHQGKETWALVALYAAG
jgi:hypothetical protein